MPDRSPSRRAHHPDPRVRVPSDRLRNLPAQRNNGHVEVSPSGTPLRPAADMVFGTAVYQNHEDAYSHLHENVRRSMEGHAGHLLTRYGWELEMRRPPSRGVPGSLSWRLEGAALGWRGVAFAKPGWRRDSAPSTQIGAYEFDQASVHVVHLDQPGPEIDRLAGQRLPDAHHLLRQHRDGILFLSHLPDTAQRWLLQPFTSGDVRQQWHHYRGAQGNLDYLFYMLGNRQHVSTIWGSCFTPVGTREAVWSLTGLTADVQRTVGQDLGF